MSNLYDLINRIDETTNKLKDTKTLIWSICENYLEDKQEDVMLAEYDFRSRYGTISDLSHLAGRMLFDLIDEYGEISYDLQRYHNAMSKIIKEGCTS